MTDICMDEHRRVQPSCLYPPITMGAFFQPTNDSINPLTLYQAFKVAKSVVPTAKKMNIIDIDSCHIVMYYD